MSTQIACDNCGATVTVAPDAAYNHDADELGELGGWIRLASYHEARYFHACTRSCAIELLSDDGAMQAVIDAATARNARIARAHRTEPKP